MTDQTLFEYAFRLVAALAWSGTLWVSLRGRWPTPSGRYVVGLAIAMTTWRWFLFGLAFIDERLAPDTLRAVGQIVNGINQGLAVVLAAAVVVMVREHCRG